MTNNELIKVLWFSEVKWRSSVGIASFVRRLACLFLVAFSMLVFCYRSETYFRINNVPPKKKRRRRWVNSWRDREDFWSIRSSQIGFDSIWSAGQLVFISSWSPLFPSRNENDRKFWMQTSYRMELIESWFSPISFLVVVLPVFTRHLLILLRVPRCIYIYIYLKKE